MIVSSSAADGSSSACLLAADDGRVLARFLALQRGGRAWADALEPVPGVPVDVLAPAILRDLAGHTVSSPPEVGRALVAAGGRPGRHGHVMRRDLDVVPAGPAPPRGVRVGRLDHPATALAPAMMAAYPPGHPDFRPGGDEVRAVAESLDRILAGEEVGPLLPCSRVAQDAAGRVLGAAVLTDAPVEPPFGGPWVAELFRAPGHPGVGRALLAAAIRAAARDGHATLGLVVTEGNPARRLYEAAGFALVSSWLNVDLS